MKNKILFAMALMGCAAQASAGDWRVGPAISAATGLSDVTDIYEENYNNTHINTQVEVEYLIPIGLAVQGTYTWETGVRLDLGLGPFFFFEDSGAGDIDTGLSHTEVPVSATVGYTFIPGGEVSPYLRAGVAYHFASGDYVEGSEPGLLGAVGIEFLRKSFATVAIEVAFDRSEVELERFRRVGVVTTRRTENVNTYDTVIAVIVKF